METDLGFCYFFRKTHNSTRHFCWRWVSGLHTSRPHSPVSDLCSGCAVWKSPPPFLPTTFPYALLRTWTHPKIPPSSCTGKFSTALGARVLSCSFHSCFAWVACSALHDACFCESRHPPRPQSLLGAGSCLSCGRCSKVGADITNARLLIPHNAPNTDGLPAEGETIHSPHLCLNRPLHYVSVSVQTQATACNFSVQQVCWCGKL